MVFMVGFMTYGHKIAGPENSQPTCKSPAYQFHDSFLLIKYEYLEEKLLSNRQIEFFNTIHEVKNHIKRMKPRNHRQYLPFHFLCHEPRQHQPQQQ